MTAASWLMLSGVMAAAPAKIYGYDPQKPAASVTFETKTADPDFL
jgi:hypothetical protein